MLSEVLTQQMTSSMKIDLTAVEVSQPDLELANLIAGLDPSNSWGDRQMAAKKLGNLRNAEAVPALLYTLTTDRFWMVRSAIIHALIMIGDREAVPALMQVSETDEFMTVRSYAVKAVAKLSEQM